MMYHDSVSSDTRIDTSLDDHVDESSCIVVNDCERDGKCLSQLRQQCITDVSINKVVMHIVAVLTTSHPLPRTV